VKVQIGGGLGLECLDSSQSNVTETSAFIYLRPSFGKDHCVVRTNEGSTFGVLNNRTFRRLAKLPCFQDLEYTVLIASNNWKGRIFQAGKDSKRRCISLDINISGPRCELDIIARELSSAGLFLQPPHHGTTILPYENPQYLHLPGLIQVVELPVVSSSHNPSSGARGTLEDELPLAPNAEYPDFDKFLDELPRYNYLKEAIVDIRVMTHLLR
jgi:hypothetical protein